MQRIPVSGDAQQRGHALGETLRQEIRATCLGTVCSVVMDLPGRQASITPGNPREHDYERFAL